MNSYFGKNATKESYASLNSNLMATKVRDELDETVQLVKKLRVQRDALELQNTELQIMQRNMEVERDLFHSLFEFAPMGYFILGEDGTILNVNLSGASILGKERGTLIGDSFQEYVCTEDEASYQCHLRDVFAIKQLQKQGVHLVKQNGETFHAQLNSVLLPEYHISSKWTRTIISNVMESPQEQVRNPELPSFDYLQTPIIRGEK